jgi:hypothetical protein
VEEKGAQVEGALLDLGVIRLPSRTFPAFMRRPPWNRLARIVPPGDLFSDHGSRMGKFVGAHNEIVCFFKGQYEHEVYISKLDLLFAPTTLRFEGRGGGVVQKGDSGGPLTTSDMSGLVGLHFLGFHGSPSYDGLCLSATSIVEYLQERTGGELRLVTRPHWDP